MISCWTFLLPWTPPHHTHIDGLQPGTIIQTVLSPLSSFCQGIFIPATWKKTETQVVDHWSWFFNISFWLDPRSPLRFSSSMRLYFWLPWFCVVWLPGMSKTVEFSGFSACKRGFSVCGSVSQPSSECILTYLLLLVFCFSGEPWLTGSKFSFSTDMVKCWLLTAWEDWQSHSPQGLLWCYLGSGGSPCYSVGDNFPFDLCWGMCGNYSWFCVLVVGKVLVLLGYLLLSLCLQMADDRDFS